MEDNDLEKLGRLINASHISLHYDYEVTGKELDTLAEAAWKQNVGKIYRDAVGYDASFYDAEIVDGTKRI